MRTVFREATILGREPDGLLDIVVDDGRIADIGKTIAAAGEEIRLGGKLATPGMVETHIHLDKACILDRCAPEPETGPTEHAARAVGAAPGYDSDNKAQIDRVFELARAYDVDIDMHLDFGNTPDDMDVHYV